MGDERSRARDMPVCVEDAAREADRAASSARTDRGPGFIVRGRVIEATTLLQ